MQQQTWLNTSDITFSEILDSVWSGRLEKNTNLEENLKEINQLSFVSVYCVLWYFYVGLS